MGLFRAPARVSGPGFFHPQSLANAAQRVGVVSSRICSHNTLRAAFSTNEGGADCGACRTRGADGTIGRSCGTSDAGTRGTIGTRRALIALIALGTL